MSNLHRCRLCLKWCRNKIHIYKDDFPKMIEILTGLKVDPFDDFPKNSCIDCANNVKIALRTKKQIIKSHKILLEEFLAKCKGATSDKEKEMSSDSNNDKEGNSNNLNLENGTVTSLSSKAVTRSHSKAVASCGNNSLIDKKYLGGLSAQSVTPKEEEVQEIVDTGQTKSVRNCDDVQKQLGTKKEYYSDDSNGEDTHPLSDIEWTPDKKEEKETNSKHNKPEKRTSKPILKGSDGVFFVKKRSLLSKKNKSSQTVIRIKKKPKGRTPASRVTCDLCKKEVKSYWIQKHMETHQYNPVTCEFCGLVSKSPTALRHHVYYYHRSTADEYMCDQCGRSFRSKYRLNLHKKKEHGGTKDFECTTCGKMFFERMHLKRHVDKTHKNIRPYVCDFCGKSFKSRNHIKIHERIHSKEAPYTCHMCGESFKMKLTLRTHLKGVHNVQEVQKVFCDICKRGFASDMALRAHINSRIHETEKCQYCSEMFTREYMINHLRDVHGVESTPVE